MSEYPTYGDCPSRPGLYLGLFHGFPNEEAREEADGVWGEEGPLIGPLRYCHTTYGVHIKFEFVDEEAARLYEKLLGILNVTSFPHGDIMLSDDLAVVGDMEYGDWTVFYVSPQEVARGRLRAWDEQPDEKDWKAEYDAVKNVPDMWERQVAHIEAALGLQPDETLDIEETVERILEAIAMKGN